MPHRFITCLVPTAQYSVVFALPFFHHSLHQSRRNEEYLRHHLDIKIEPAAKRKGRLCLDDQTVRCHKFTFSGCHLETKQAWADKEEAVDGCHAVGKLSC